ncbi:MAG: DUF167 domain-containing protein [Candidatus Brocadiaceae bacterium]|nr:DUF167 domain-containing protein [Candidatus Brocadiaceae bacterium]
MTFLSCISVLDVISAHSGSIVFLKVQPGAKKNCIIGEYGGRLKVAVTAAPEKGKANKAIIKLLAETLHVHESSVSIISGESSRDKRLMIRSVTPEDVKALLSPQL